MNNTLFVAVAEFLNHGDNNPGEPWRNTYAQLMAEMGWSELQMNFDELELLKYFESKPLATYNTMLAKGSNAPVASSCGRLFDAVAAAMGICRDSVIYEGQAAIELEAIVDQHTLHNEEESLAYPFTIPRLTVPGFKHKLPYKWGLVYASAP
jgi:hydrogenase maturation protein HypF